MIPRSTKGIPAGRYQMALGAFPLQGGVFVAILARHILKAAVLGEFADIGEPVILRTLDRTPGIFGERLFRGFWGWVFGGGCHD